jgi:hypothetical protein
MTKVMTRFSDAMLGALLGKEEAGACVPEHGDSCCAPSNGVCVGSDYFRYYRKGTINCNGVCVTSTSAAVCYRKKAGVC